MIRVIVAGLLAFGGLMTTAVGVANADEIQAGVYSTLSACEADGPHIELSQNDSLWTHYECRQGGDGLYHLYLTN